MGHGSCRVVKRVNTSSDLIRYWSHLQREHARWLTAVGVIPFKPLLSDREPTGCLRQTVPRKLGTDSGQAGAGICVGTVGECQAISKHPRYPPLTQQLSCSARRETRMQQIHVFVW